MKWKAVFKYSLYPFVKPLSFYNVTYEIRSPTCQLKIYFPVFCNPQVPYLSFTKGRKTDVMSHKAKF